MTSFVVLVGGESRRMGRDKALLEVGGRPLLIRVLEVAERIAEDCILVTPRPEEYVVALRDRGWRPISGPPGESAPAALERGETRLRWVPDLPPGRGPVAGIEAGLGAARHPLCFVAACDLPFLDPAPVRALVERLAVLRSGGDGGPHAVVPEANGRLQPLAAAYACEAGRIAAELLERGERSAAAFLGRLRVRRVPTAELERETGQPAAGSRWFLNVNRPEDLRRARSLARDGADRSQEDRAALPSRPRHPDEGGERWI